MKVAVVVAPGCFDSGLTIVLDILRGASAGRSLVDADIPPIEVMTVASDRGPVRTGGGLLVPIDRTIDELGDDLDVLVVPALGSTTPASVEDALQRKDIRALRTSLIRWRDDGHVQFAAACTGTFLLADAGLLDRRRATTSWWLTDMFEARFPNVELDMTQMVVRDGPTTTAGTAFAHIDLAMSLVGRVSPQLADTTASMLLIDPRPARSVDAAAAFLDVNDELVLDFESWVRANLDRAIAVDDAAAAIGTNRRTLERRIQQRLGTTPYRVIRRLRVERANHLRRTTPLSFDEIAPMVGYRSGASLRSAVRSATSAS